MRVVHARTFEVTAFEAKQSDGFRKCSTHPTAAAIIRRMGGAERYPSHVDSVTSGGLVPPSLRGAIATKQFILSFLGEMDCFACARNDDLNRDLGP